MMAAGKGQPGSPANRRTRPGAKPDLLSPSQPGTPRPDQLLNPPWATPPPSGSEALGLTQNPQPVVDGDDDDVAVAGQDAAVDHVARPLHVGAPVDVDHDRLQSVFIVDVCGEHRRIKTSNTGV